MVFTYDSIIKLTNDVTNTLLQSHSIDWKLFFGVAMRTYDVHDAWNPYEHGGDAMGVNF